jgi:putative DNA-invertase from lambdoid prophage Rac
MRYVIFTRVSTDRQTVENQLLECKRWLSREIKEGDTVHEFNEPDTTSRIPMEKRKVLQEMLAFVKAGDTLVLTKLDRLARDGEELVYIYRKLLLKRGIKVISLYEPYVNHIMIFQFAYFAEAERDMIRQRTLSGYNRKKSNGEKYGSTLWGYAVDEEKLSPHHEAKSEGKPYLLIKNEEEQKAINMMIDLYNQNYSYGEIEKAVEDAGFRTRKGTVIRKAQIHKILKRMPDETQDHLELAECH